LAKVFLSEPAEEELRKLSPRDQEEVARAMSFLEDDGFRDQNKVDLCLREDNFQIYALLSGTVWLAFYTNTGGTVNVVHLSMHSRFRSL